MIDCLSDDENVVLVHKIGADVEFIETTTNDYVQISLHTRIEILTCWG